MSRLMYSVWDAPSLSYDYYVSQGELRAGVFADPSSMPAPKTAIGLSHDAAARVLPRSAKLVGRGKVAKGMIASHSASSAPLSGMLDFDPGTVKWIAVAGIAWFAWTKLLSPRTRAKVRGKLGV